MFLNFQVFGDFFPPSILLLFISHLTLLWSEITFCVLVPMTDTACSMVQHGVCLACSVVQRGVCLACFVVQRGGLSCLICGPAWGLSCLFYGPAWGLPCLFRGPVWGLSRLFYGPAWGLSLVSWSSVGSVSLVSWSSVGPVSCSMVQREVCLEDCFACSLKGPPSIEVVQITSVFTDFFCLLILSVIENGILKSPVTTVDF